MQIAGDKYEFRVRWHPFLLRPQMPKEGVPKPPETPQSPRVNPHLKQVGENVGINFTGKSDKYPNTLQAHVLLDYASSTDDGNKQNDLAELLFKSYFTDGRVLEPELLAELAEQAGLDRGEAARVINDEAKLQDVKQKALEYSAKGINGVPYFYMNGQKTFSGAQDQENFLRFFDIIKEKFPLEGKM